MNNTVILVLSGTDNTLLVPFNPNATLKETLSATLRGYLAEEAFDKVRFLHQGRLLNSILSSSMKEAGLKEGDTIVALNHLCGNDIAQKLQPKAKLQIPTAQPSSMEYMNELDRIIQGAEQRADKKAAKDFKITPEVIAQMTGAQKPVKLPVQRIHDQQDSFGGGSFMDIMMRMMNRRVGGAEGAQQRPPVQELPQEIEADQGKVASLVEMGFPQERAKAALKHFRNNVDRAMDYLISTPPEADAHILSSSRDRPAGNSIEVFVVNEGALNQLMEMGYERNDAVYALKITGNNVEHACTYLMQNPAPSRGVALGDMASAALIGSRLAGLEQQRDAIDSQSSRLQNALQRLLQAQAEMNQRSSEIFRGGQRGPQNNDDNNSRQMQISTAESHL